MIRSIALLIICGVIGTNLLSASGESNICGFNGNYVVCCSGYQMDKYGECTVPVCVNGCGRGGECIRPDTCRCFNGRLGPFCLDEDSNNNLPALYRDAECPQNCNLHGTCIDGVCKCKPGYMGEACLEEQLGECYLNITRGVCMKLQRSLRLSMDMCCGAFDVAWGDTCKRCERARCQKGFLEVDGICEDINECLVPEICQAGKCVNMHGSFRCQCSATYQFDPVQADCVQMKKKCDQIPNLCGIGMECVSLSVYKHVCKCLPGYVKTRNGKSCYQPSKVVFNLCNSYGKYVCQFGKCIPDGYSYKCECNAGYTPSSDKKSCKRSIDYCALYANFLCPNGKCVPLINDYACKCEPGYTLSYDRKKCTSICDLYPTSLCPNGQCVPQANNGYECRCNVGYAAIGKGKQCRRIMNDQSMGSSPTNNDESSTLTKYDTDFCAYTHYSSQCQGGRCVNMKNNYYCECLPDYTIDKNGQACKKKEVYVPTHMNDAASSINLRSYCDKYGSLVCSKGRCLESGTSYQCKCNSGYQESMDGKSCLDIDECSATPTICEQGTCRNSPGSYQCSCYDGFTIHYVPGGPKCYDRNECDEDKSLCENGQCVNTWGSFKCLCHSGYIVSNQNQHCVAVQRSSDNPTIRSSQQICSKCSFSCTLVNRTKWQCSCPQGSSSVLNTGLCAPLIQVVDVQFDIPNNIHPRIKRASSNISYIYFELVSTANSENFLSKVTSQYKNVVLDKCEISKKEGRKTGVICFYHNNL